MGCQQVRLCCLFESRASRLKCNGVEASSSFPLRGVVLTPTLPAASSAQDCFVLILIWTQVPEQLFLMINFGEASAFCVLEEEHLEHCLITGARTESCAALRQIFVFS